MSLPVYAYSYIYACVHACTYRYGTYISGKAINSLSEEEVIGVLSCAKGEKSRGCNFLY